MKITLQDQPATRQQGSSTQQLRFDKLWKQLESKQKRNTKLKRELECLMVTYREQVMPVEMELQRANVTEVERLITFFGRKSLSKGHRHELADWIGDILEDLAQQESSELPRLAERFNAAIAAYQGMSQEELEAEMEEARQQMEDSFEDLFDVFGKGPEAAEGDEASNQDDLFGSQDDIFGAAEDESFRFDGNGNGQGQGHNHDHGPELESNRPRAEQLLSGKWIRGLFRRTAQVLHPDKEQDPKQRAHKEQLMSQLLEARDKQDVMTMLQLHSEHVGDGQMQVAAEEMQALCELLVQQKEALDAEKFDIIHESPFQHAVYEALYAVSPKTRDKKLHTHLEGVREATQHKREQVDYLRNLSRLKEVLDYRYEETAIYW